MVGADADAHQEIEIGGGATWGWYSYDPELNLVYYGSGNPSTWNPVQRPGDNRWSMSIWARDLDTGQVKWIYQMTPHDEWDYDGVNEMILTDQSIDGKARKLLTPAQHAQIGAWIKHARTPERILQMPAALWRTLELASVLMNVDADLTQPPLLSDGT